MPDAAVKTAGIALLIFAFGITSPPATAASFNQEHAVFDTLLKRHVKEGRVNYRALKATPAPLAKYLRQLASVRRPEFARWTASERLAFLINLYNAATLQLVVDHYPVKSIKDIGGFFSGPWKQKVVPLFGDTVTLDHLEHAIIRRDYPDPRVHFALVCAAKGCPPLRSEAYVGDRLDQQLDAQGRLFMSQRHKNRVVGDRLYLSPIFKWFAEDFAAHPGGLQAFVKPFFGKSERRALSRHLKIRYTDYDWSLNDAKIN